MRRSRSVLVSTITVFLVMAMVAVGMCGPPPSGGGPRSAAPGPGLNNMGGVPSGDAGGQGAGALGGGLTATPGGGYGGAGGSGAGSPGLVLSAIHKTKYDITNVQRASYFIPFCQMNSGLRIVGDWYSKKYTESGVYGGSQADPRDARYGNNLYVDWNVNLYSLAAQLDYQPLSCAKSLKIGPAVGVQQYTSSFRVTDNTNPALSDVNARKSTPTFGTLGAWVELGLPGLLGAAAGRSSCGSSCDACPVMSRIYASATGGVAKDWNSFNYEVLLSLFTAKKGTVWSDSKYGKYIPALSTDIGYMATYLTESRHDYTSSQYLSSAYLATVGANTRALTENSKVNFITYVLRFNLAF